MMHASYELFLLTSPVRELMPRLRTMVSPLYRLHHKTVECVELYYSPGRDAALLRVCFSELHQGEAQRCELAQSLSERGFEVIESSEIAATDKPRFERVLRDQYEVRGQHFPSPGAPSVVSSALDALEVQLEPMAVSALVEQAPVATQVPVPRAATRLTTVDAFELVISEMPAFDVDVEGSKDAIELAEYDRAPTTLDAEDQEDPFPLRMETFGPLDEMIAKLPRAETGESLDAILGKLWP